MHNVHGKIAKRETFLHRQTTLTKVHWAVGDSGSENGLAKPCTNLMQAKTTLKDLYDDISHMLTEEEDKAYLRKVARERDADGLQKKLKLAQIDADKVKVVKNHAKETRRQEKRDMFWRIFSGCALSHRPRSLAGPLPNDYY